MLLFLMNFPDPVRSDFSGSLPRAGVAGFDISGAVDATKAGFFAIDLPWDQKGFGAVSAGRAWARAVRRRFRPHPPVLADPDLSSPALTSLPLGSESRGFLLASSPGPPTPGGWTARSSTPPGRRTGGTGLSILAFAPDLAVVGVCGLLQGLTIGFGCALDEPPDLPPIFSGSRSTGGEVAAAALLRDGV